MNRLRQLALSAGTASVLALVLGACAGTGNPNADGLSATQQTLRVEVLDAQGLPMPGLNCRLSNPHGFVVVKTGEPAVVTRSNQDLSIDCEAPGSKQPTTARLRPRAGTAQGVGAGNSSSVYGAVGLGSGGSRGGVGINIGFPIGIKTATADSHWRYPEWVQLRLGKALMFDAEGTSEKVPAPAYQSLP